MMSSDPTIDTTTDPPTRPTTRQARARTVRAGLETSVNDARRAVPPPADGGPVMTIAAIYGRRSADDERSVEDGRSVDRQVALARQLAGPGERRTMIAALYLRKSSTDERSAEDGKSIERQREHATAFAAKRSWTVSDAHVYVDDAVSGAEFAKRPGLTRLLTALESKAFDVLVVMDQSRLGRDTIRTLSLIQAVQDTGVKIFGYLDDREITVDGEVPEVESFMRSWADTKARRDARTRTRDALTRKARLGQFTGGRTYGYRIERVGDHSERRVDEAQAAIIRRVFHMAADGIGDQRIANVLSAERVPAPGPRVWAKDAVARILRNDTYRGVARFGMTRAVDRSGSASKRERVDPAAWVRADVPHLRIIDDDLWRRVQARKERTKEHYLRAPDGTLGEKPESALAARFLLSGIARCACGGALGVMGSGSPLRRYRCIERARRGPAACQNARGIPVEVLDAEVLQRLHDMLTSDGEAVAALCEERDQRLRVEQETQGDRRAEALAEAEKVEAEIQRMLGYMRAGTASPDVVTEIERLRARVEELKATPAPPPAFDRAAFFRRFAGARKIAMLLEPSYPAQVRQVLRKLRVDRVTVRMSPDRKSWDFAGSLDLSCLVKMETPAPSEKPVLGADFVYTTSGFMRTCLPVPSGESRCPPGTARRPASLLARPGEAPRRGPRSLSRTGAPPPIPRAPRGRSCP
jgi:DNA invertase Pin-like site-specific DNA recombinase